MALIIGLTDRERRVHSSAMSDLSIKLADLSRTLLEPEEDGRTLLLALLVMSSVSRLSDLQNAIMASTAESDFPIDLGGEGGPK